LGFVASCACGLYALVFVPFAPLLAMFGLQERNIIQQYSNQVTRPWKHFLKYKM